METDADNFTKQYINNRDKIFTHQPTTCRNARDGQSSLINLDEPIDLTSSASRSFSEESNAERSIVETKTIFANQVLSNTREAVQFFTPEFPVKRHRKRKQFTIGSYRNTLEDQFQNSPSKQEEVLKAAKSLFSKRTRTLYHWMYPNAPKQQIKSAVATSWDSLGTQEKEFYISQVLGRFGFPPCSLMINPQLGGIKELPPLPDTQDFISSTSSELQSAISSISDTSSINENRADLVATDRADKKNKKKKGRPFGSKNKIVKNDVHNVISQEFHDDPELRKEFEQFALFMYESRIK